MKRLNRFVLLALVYPFAVAKVLGRRVGLREAATSTDAKPKSLFEALRSPKAVRRVGLGLVLVMASTFAALQATAIDTGSDSTIDYALQTPGGAATSTGFAQGPSNNFPNLSTNATWEAWLYPTDGAGYDPFINKEQSFVFAVVDGAYQWAFGNGSTWSNPSWYSTFVAAPLNTWQHVAFVKADSNLKFYLNGSLAFERTLAYSSLGSSSSLPLTVGGRINSDHFKGRIDEVRIWNSARSASQIATAMHQNYKTVGTPSDLLGYWDFNEPSGTDIYNRATAVANTPLIFQGTPSREDVKQVTSVAGGDTVVSFPRTYLPGTGTWTAPTGASKSRALVVAGGGGGGGREDGGGGGAGGVVEFPSLSLSATLKVVVGQGGNGGLEEASVKNHGANGQDTSLGTVIALGGGGGGGYGYSSDLNRAQGNAGGSGGGHGEYGTSLAAAAGLQKTDGVNYDGGVEYGNAGGSIISASQAGSGGGGAGSAGGNVTTFRVGGVGGSGMPSNITGGTDKFYAAGGGGADRDGAGASGGSSIGGDGGGTSQRTHAVANTGSGGGGASGTGLRSGGNGSAGIVIIRYTNTQDFAYDGQGSSGQQFFTSTTPIPRANNAAFTVETWIYPTASTNYRPIMASNAGSNGRFWFGLSPEGWVHYDLGNGNGTNAGTNPVVIPNDQWTHLAITVTGAISPTVKIFANATEIYSATYPSTRNALYSSLNVGTNESSGNIWPGQVDQVKVWNTVLVPADLLSSMHSYSTGTGNASAANLLAHYDFNEFLSGTEPDRSGKGFNLSSTSQVTKLRYKDDQIISTNKAFSETQNVVKFNRSYLTAAGGWTPPAGITRYKAVVVAGGGGGGAWVGGGGGAGGLLQSPSVDLTQSAIKVQVGQGGGGAKWSVSNTGVASYSQYASSGQNSAVGSSLTATGGGYGGSHRPGTSGDAWISLARATPATGGSGGGGSGKQSGAGDWTASATGATGTPGQGNSGGSGISGSWQAAGGGGAGAVGSPGITYFAGPGGAGLAVNITGTSLTLAGGGAGANHDNPTQTAAGGVGGGGQGGNMHALDGSANTGGGGGGGANNSTAGNSSSGGEGGSGSIILSYGATMEVVQTPGGARAGTAFSRPITVQLKNADETNSSAAGVSVTLSAASASVLQKTVGEVTTNVTSVPATSDANGLVTFTGVGFQAGVGTAAQVLTFSADAFVGTTLSVAPTFVSTSVTVSTTATTNGEFVNGLFQATTASATNIRASDLITALSSSNVLVESAGNISVSTGLTSTSTNNLSMTCAGTGAFTNAGGAISLASDLSVNCATVTTSATITTSGTGGVSLTSHTGLMSVGAAISSAKDITLLPKTTYSGAGSLTASAGAVQISGGSTVDPTGAILASGNLVLRGSGQITTATNATITSSNGSVEVTTTGGLVTLSKNVLANASIAISLTGAYSGLGTLTATNGTISISGGTSVAPGGAVSAKGNVTVAGSGQALFSSMSVASASGEISVTAGPVAAHAIQIQNATVTAANQRISLIGSSTTGEGVYILNNSTVSTTSGALEIKGVGADYGVWLESANILSASGNITIDSGVRGLVAGWNTTTTIGATSSGSASGDITVLGDRHWSGSTAVNYKTTGKVILNSKAANYIEAPTYNNHIFTGASSVEISSLNATYTVTVDAVATIAGPFSVHGQWVRIDGGSSVATTLVAAPSGQRNIGILVKATDRIELAAGADFETGGSDIVVWSDSDNSGIGSINLAGTNVFKSKGGKISIAGGLDDGGVVNPEFVNRSVGDGHPDNYAAGVSGWGDSTGVEMLGGYEILSGGGDTFIAGRGSAAAGDHDWGVLMGAGIVFSGSGKIGVYGKSPLNCANNWHRGIATGWGARTNLISESTATDALYLYGNTSACNNTGSVYASAVESQNDWTSLAAPNGGGIKIYGIQGNASFTGTADQDSNTVQLRYVNLISNTGPINIQAENATSSARYNIRFAWDSGSRRSIGALASAWATGYPAYPTIAAVASSSSVTLKADTMQPAFADFRTSGHLKFLPNTTFAPSSLINLSSDWGVQFPVKVASFLVGAPGTGGANQTKADVDLAALSSVGSINIYGKELTFEGALSSDAATGTGVQLKATGSITGVGSVTTQGADAIFWTRAGSANSSADEGELSINNSATISTGGGKIVMAGSTSVDANGHPSGDIFGNGGNATQLGTGNASPVAISTGNGDLRIYSRAGPNASLALAYISNGTEAAINSGLGRQDLRFVSSGTDNVFESWGPITFTSSAIYSATNPAIKFAVAQTDSSKTMTPVQQQGTFLHKFIASGGGDLSVAISSANEATYAIDFARNFKFLASSGLITVDLGKNGIDLQHATASNQVEFGADSAGSSSSNITIISDRFPEVVANAATSGVVAKTSGTVTIRPSSVSFSANQNFDSTWAFAGISGLLIGENGNIRGVSVSGTNSVAGNLRVIGGSVALTGSQTTTGSGNITVTASDNIVIEAGSSVSSKTNIQTSGGAITLQSDSDGNSDGYVWIQNFTNISTGVGAGNILISGGTDPSTGFATAASVDGQNRPGVHFGAFVGSIPGYAEGVTVAAGTGDVVIRGKAIGNAQGRGILMPLSSTLANKSSITGNNITLVGNSEGATDTTWYGIEFGQSSGQTATDIKTLLSATGTLTVTGTSSNYDGIVGNGNYEFVGKQIAMTGSGPRQPIRINTTSTLASSIAAGLDGFSYTGTKTNTVTNDSALFKPGSFSSAGATSFVFDGSTSTAGLSIDSAIAVTNAEVTVKANNVDLTGSINVGTGSVEFEPFTSSRAITAGGTEVAGTLSLTAAELGRVTASMLRLTAGGDVNLTSNLTFTGKVSTLAIRSGANVSASSGVAVVVANLGIDAVGTITMGGGHSISGNLALNGSGATFSQTSMNYTPNTVDTIAASFGTGDVLSVTAIPAVNTASTDQFMAVTFSPPPVATVKDKYSNSLETRNTLSDDYKVTVTKTSGAGTLSGTTSINAVLGVATFSDLKITGNTGDHVFNFALAPITGTATFGTSSVDSGTYNVQAGDPDNLNVLTPASGGTSGAAFTTQPVIQIRDVANNLVALDPGKSAVVTATISAGGTRVGSATATAVNSVATFSGLGIKGLISGNYTITYSIVFNSATISKAQTGITILSGVATTLEVAQPASVSNAAVFATQPVVTAKDSAGNTATTQVGTVTVAGTSLTGTKTKALVDGVASFAGQGLKLTGTIGTYPLTYTMGSLSTISGVQLTHGVATQLSLTTPAAGFVNRQVFDTAPIITVLDVSNNPVLNSVAQVTIESTNAVLSGTVTMPAVDGIADFANKGLKLTGTAGDQVLTYKATNLTSASQSFTLLHGAAYELRLVTDGAGAKSGVEFTTSPRVEILDQDANLVDTGAAAGATIAASISGAAYNSVAHTGVDLLGTVSLDAVAGVATFNNLRLEGVASSYTLTFSATAPVAVAAFTDSQTIGLVAGTATKLRPVAQPADVVAGVAFGTTVTVEVLDAYNNRVLVAANNITPTLIDTASTPNTIATKTAVAATSGLTTFTGLTFTKAGAHKIVFSATDLTSTTSAEFAITNAAPHHLTWVTQPTGAKNGVALSSAPVLEVRDEFENPALVGAATTVAATIQPANTDVISVSGASVTSAANARVTFANLILKAKAGNYGLRFTAANGTLPINGTYIDTTSTVAIAQGDPENLNVLTPASGGTSDAAFTTQPVIQIRDSANNLVLGELGESAVVTATISGGGTRVGSATATAVDSVATFADLGIKGLVSGSYTITYSIEFNSATISKAQTGITIGSGVATVLEVVQPAEVSNAAVFATQPVVTAKDSAGNIATTQVGTVTVANGNLTGTKTKALVAGVANFSGQDLKLTGTIGAYSLEYTMGSLKTISGVQLKHGVATKLELTTPAAGFVNRQVFETAPVITVLDVSDNQVLDSAVEITVESTNAALSGTFKLNAVSGRANFADKNLKLTGTVGAQTLTYKATDLTSASQSFTLLHGVATKLELTTVASAAKAGIAFGGQPVVRVLDADNNLVKTGDNASATIAVSTSAAAYNAANHTGADLLGTLSAQASAGVATFAGLHIDGVAATYSLSFSATAPTGIAGFTAVTQTLEVAAGTQTALRTVAQPTDIVAGVAFGTAVTVEILDAFNNRVLVATNDIKPTLIDTALVPATVDATKTAVAAVDGLATFTGLTFTKAGSHKVLFTATNAPSADLTSATSSAFTITNAAPHHLTWITQPTGAKNDVALSPAPVLEVRDEFENPALTGDATTVAATIQPANTDVLTVSGASATSNTSARVTFANLVLKAKIGNYGLRFTGANGTLPINGTYIDTTSTVAITHGDPTQLVITTPAAAAKAGFAFGTQPAVEVRDSAANRVADSALTITASMTNRDIIGTATAVASNGVATFANLGLNGALASGLQLNFKTTFNSTEIATSQLINLAAGAAVEVVMTQQPATVKTRDAFTIAPSVTLLDLWKNPVLSDNTTEITAQLINSSGAAIGDKSAAVAAADGTATFSTLAFTATPASGYRIKFEMAAGGDTVTSDAFTINPGTATKLLITTHPATLELNGSKTKTGELLATQPVAKLYDQDDNLVTTANSGSATVSINSGVGASLSEGSTTANFVGGIATFAGVKLVGTPNAAYTLEFASDTPNPALTSGASNAISVIHNDAHHLVLTRDAATGRAGDAFDVQPQITIQDRYSNTVTTGTGAGLTVRASAEITAPTAGAATLVGGTQRNAIAGVANFSTLGIGGSTANTYKINFSISSSTVVAASQSDIQISYGYSDRVVMVTQPVGGNATGAGLATQPVVAVQDAYGNLVANAADTVTASIVSTVGLTLADASVARVTGNIIDAANGTATFTDLRLFGLPTTSYRLQFSIGLNPATANAISVTHAVAHHATIVTHPVGGNATGANLAGQPIVELRDQFENIVTSNSTDVLTAHLASSTGTNLAGGSTDPERLAGSTTATFSAGIATFAGLKVIALPETLYTLNFDATVGSTPISSLSSNTFGVTYSTATQLAVFQQPVANVTGELLTTQPIIEVQDIYGNRVRNYVGTVAVTLPQVGSTLSNSTYAGAASQFEAIVADGRATFSGLEITAIPGTDYQLNFASSPLTTINSANLRVVAAAPFEVLMVNQPVGAQTNAELSGQPSVRVVDRFGNIVLSDNSTVITASIIDGAGGVLSRVSGGTAQSLTTTVVAGVGTFDHLRFRGVSLRNYKLTFASSGLAAANSNDFFVTHADASKLIIFTPPEAGATGLALTTQPILELRDFDENVAATDNSSVVTASITSGDGRGTLTNATATANEGVVTFAGLTLTGTPNVAYQITFTGDLGVLGSVTSLPSGNVVPLHGAPNKLAMRGTAVVGGLVGEDLVAQPKLNVLDSFGNLATTDNLTVVTASILADSTGEVLGTTTATAVNGLVDFSGLKATGTPGTAYTLRFSATSSGATLATADSSTFTLSKQADVSLSYATRAYAPDAVVAPLFATDSPGVVTYLNTTTEEDICTLNTTTGAITIKGAGTCSVNVSVAATTYYLANSVDADLEIAKARQTPITITSAATVNYWGTVYPAASGGSGEGVMTFAVNGTCKLVTNTVIPGDAGSRCQLTATKPGDVNYLPEGSATQTIRVLKIDQAPLMMASASDLKVGTLTLVAAGGSGTGALTYGVETTNLANSANCSIVGAVLTATTNGVCSVKATKAASTNYNVKETSIQLITVSKQEQSVAFTSTVPMFPVALGTYTPTASASSALAVGFTLVTDAQNPTCQFDPLNRAKVVFLIAGECKIVASQAGNGVFSSASASQTIQVGILNQSIVFAAITDKSFGTPGFMVSASSNSGLPVALATTSNSTACTLSSNGLVALTGAGLCEISATQAGNLTYGPASAVIRSFNVLADFAGAPQIISVSSASQSFTASFTEPSYTGGSPILGYKLVLTDVNGEVYTNSACALIGSRLTCTVVGLPNNIAYTAKVAAVTVAGIGSFSSSSVARTPIEAPLAVNNLAATPAAGNLVVNWDLPTVSDDVFLAEFRSYQVYVAPIGTAFSNVPSATITQANATTTTIALSNSTPIDGALVRSAAFGRASFSRAAVSTPTPTPSPTTASIAGYNIRVVTVTTAAAVSTNDNTTNGVQIGFAVPFAPAQMILDPLTTSLWISWSAPTADGGQPVLNYDVRVNGELVCPATTELECTFVGMTAGTTYNVEVFARSSVGLSPAAFDSYSVPAPPAPYVPPVVIPSPDVTSPGPVVPTVKPTVRPTVKPTVRPTAEPTAKPSASSSASPSGSPTASPSEGPTDEPTDGPIAKPEDPSGPQGNGGDLPPFIPGAPVANPAIGATGDDEAPSVPFDPLATEEGVKALTKTTAGAAAIAAAIAAAAAAAAAARGSRSSGSGGSSAPSGDAGSVANIDAAHEQYRLRRRGRGDKWKIWKLKFMTWFDKPSVTFTVASGKFSPLLTRILEDGAYLRAAFGSFAILPTIAAVAISVTSLIVNGENLQPPTWQLFLAIAVIGIFDTFAGAIGTAVFVVGALAIHGFSDLNDIRMLLGVIIVGYGPALLANAFRAFRKVPEAGTSYWWERIVDLGVLPFIGGWTTSAMISTLPALAGVTLSVANHVGDFSLAIALAIMLRVVAEEASARTFPQRLDYLHPTDVADAHKSQRWVSLVVRLAVFIFVTAALMGNDWRVWVGSVLFVLPNLLGFYADKFRNIPWLWRILPNGIPGLALTLLIATATTNMVSGWFGATPDLVLWSFALLPIPMLGLSLLHLFGREGNEGEERWIKTPKATWIYRIGGIGMLVVTMMLAGVI